VLDPEHLAEVADRRGLESVGELPLDGPSVVMSAGLGIDDAVGGAVVAWAEVSVARAEELDISVRSHRVRAQRFGSPSAPLVVAVHGLTGNMKAFDFVGERLGGDRLQLVALDLRGRGKSDTTRPGTYGWENHARDLFAVADALGVERFGVIGQSMGGSVAMKAAELDGSRLDAIVLVDVAGRVDRGVGPVVGSAVDRADAVYESAEAYLDVVKAQGLVPTWDPYWDRFYRYQLMEVPGAPRRGRRDRREPSDDQHAPTDGECHRQLPHRRVPPMSATVSSTSLDSTPAAGS
jgi:pimeloyl-ACP methyl ester carboxylesterase